MTDKTFMVTLEDLAKHVADRAKHPDAPLDEATEALKVLATVAALKLKYKEDGPDEDEDSFSGFQARLKKAEAEEERNGAAAVHGRTRRRPS